MKVIDATDIREYPLVTKGKVRDIYEIDPETLLLVTTDRMSAFDVIMGRPIPYKGVVLNQITLFWMEKFRHIVPNHIISADAKDLPANLASYSDELEGRFVLAKKAKPLPLECIVRGHITGSGWKGSQTSSNRLASPQTVTSTMPRSDSTVAAAFTCGAPPSTTSSCGG